MSPFAREFRRRVMTPLWVIGLCASTSLAHAELWVTGYYPGFEQSGPLPAAAIDFSALTHVIHFSLVPNADGTVNSDANGITEGNSTSLIALAHRAGVKVLISVGGGGTEPAFQSATSAAHLAVFINSLTNFVAARGYDGVDIDWEPCPSADFALYTNLLTGLRSALDHLGGARLLTVAAAAYPPYGDPAMAEYKMFAAFQGQLDQINIMTYDMSGPYSGWVTWFNSPLYDGGYRLPSSGALVPSVNGSVDNFVSNGVAPGKLAIAAAFYGYVWAGGAGAPAGSITQPRQGWTNTPTATAIRYTDVMTGYYSAKAYQWDEGAQAAYLSLSSTNAGTNAFVSYDDERTCRAKVKYARHRGLGGIAIWELGQDHTPGAATADPLLEAMKGAMAAPGLESRHESPGGMKLTLTDPVMEPRIKGGDTNASGHFSEAQTPP